MLQLITLIFLFTASAQGEGCRFQDNIEFPKEAVVVGVAGIGSYKEVKLAFDFKRPVILILVNYNRVKYRIVSNTKTKIVGIVTYGSRAVQIDGLGTIPVLENTEERGGPCVDRERLHDISRPYRNATTAFRTTALTRSKQLALRLFPGREFRQYWDADFQELKRIE
jgi:hypothetical protein